MFCLTTLCLQIFRLVQPNLGILSARLKTNKQSTKYLEIIRLLTIKTPLFVTFPSPFAVGTG